MCVCVCVLALSTGNCPGKNVRGRIVWGRIVRGELFREIVLTRLIDRLAFKFLSASISSCFVNVKWPKRLVQIFRLLRSCCHVVHSDQRCVALVEYPLMSRNGKIIRLIGGNRFCVFLLSETSQLARRQVTSQNSWCVPRLYIYLSPLLHEVTTSCGCTYKWNVSTVWSLGSREKFWIMW